MELIGRIWYKETNETVLVQDSMILLQDLVVQSTQLVRKVLIVLEIIIQALVRLILIMEQLSPSLDMLQFLDQTALMLLVKKREVELDQANMILLVEIKDLNILLEQRAQIELETTILVLVLLIQTLVLPSLNLAKLILVEKVDPMWLEKKQEAELALDSMIHQMVKEDPNIQLELNHQIESIIQTLDLEHLILIVEQPNLNHDMLQFLGQSAQTLLEKKREVELAQVNMILHVEIKDQSILLELKAQIVLEIITQVQVLLTLTVEQQSLNLGTQRFLAQTVQILLEKKQEAELVLDNTIHQEVTKVPSIQSEQRAQIVKETTTQALEHSTQTSAQQSLNLATQLSMELIGQTWYQEINATVLVQDSMILLQDLVVQSTQLVRKALIALETIIRVLVRLIQTTERLNLIQDMHISEEKADLMLLEKKQKVELVQVNMITNHNLVAQHTKWEKNAQLILITVTQVPEITMVMIPQLVQDREVQH